MLHVYTKEDVIMKFIYSYVKPYTKAILLGLLIKFLGTVGELMIPYVLEFMIDDVVPQQKMEKVVFWGIMMLLLALLVRFLNITANRMAVKVSRNSIFRIRRDLFWKSLNLSGSQIDEFGLPSLTSRMTSDSYNVQDFIQSMQTMGVRAPIMLFGGIIITMTMDVGLASILCIMAPIMIVVIVTISRKGIPLYEKVQASVDDIVRVMRENITGIRVVKALSKEDYEKRRFAATNEQMTQKDIHASMLMSLPGPVMTLFLNCGLVLVVIVGAYRVNNGFTQPGVILAFLTYFNMILMGVMGLNRIFMMISKANASAKRIAAVVEIEEDLQQLPDAEGAVPKSDDFIVFDHVDFSYGAESTHERKVTGQNAFTEGGRKKCLTDIDFTIRKGGSLGIIGATGCGKTTVINLLMRFYDPTSGHVFVNGKDVRTYDKDELHRMFGVVFQNDVIFADTLKENIIFGRDVDDSGLVMAADDARARDFIEAYEDTYEHKAVIHGANLSGGQRQRVLIARALAAHPQILILDDSSSALDYKTDAMLRKAIAEHHADTTMIVVAQRISSIMNLDHIMVLEEGNVIGYGTHEELMNSCQMYKDIYRTQMGEMR